MKRLSLAIMFACCRLAVAAQEGFRVDYQGARPAIKDFVKAYLTSILFEEVEECATKRMSYTHAPGFDVEYFNKSYALPRTGKDIIVTTWHKNGKKTQKTLKWNGHGFSY